MRMHEPTNSVKARNNLEPGEWEPGVPHFRFQCVLVCNKPSCMEPVLVCGYTDDEQQYDGEGGTTWEQHLYPKIFYPPPPIIQIPPRCAKAVRTEIEAAFAQYWMDRLACANRLRNAVELLLTDLKIPRYQTDNHRRRRLPLHERIRRFEQRDKDLAIRMFAVKWVGNEGSHAGKLTDDDLLDAFEIIEDLLRRVFVEPINDSVLKLAKGIHGTRRPRSHRAR